MLGVDRRDHGDRRRELEEGAVGLVGLGHEELALPEPRVGAEGADASPDDDRRVVAAFREHGADHGRRRRLAVRAGHGDGVLEPHQLGQHLRPGDGRNLALPGRLHFGVVAADGRRVHDDVRALDVVGGVPDENFCAELLEPFDRLAATGVRAADAIAEVQ
jgi:hypothetical protein